MKRETEQKSKQMADIGKIKNTVDPVEWIDSPITVGEAIYLGEQIGLTEDGARKCWEYLQSRDWIPPNSNFRMSRAAAKAQLSRLKMNRDMFARKDSMPTSVYGLMADNNNKRKDDDMSEDAVEYGVCGTRRHGGGGGLTRREQIATAIAAAAVRNDTLMRRLDGDLTPIGKYSTGVGEWAAEQADLLLKRLYRPIEAEGGAR